MSKRLNNNEVEKKILELGQQGAANYFGVSRSTLRDFAYRNNLITKKSAAKKSQAKIDIKPESVEVTSEPSTDPSDPEKIVRERGLDPNDWEFVGMTVNEWDGVTGEKQRQLKVQLKRKSSGQLILPARTDGPKFKQPKKKKIDKDGSLFVFVGDQQAPFDDPDLREKFYHFLNEHQPHTIVNIGDTMDFPDISRYKKNPEQEVNAQVQNCVNSGYEILKEQRIASSNSRIVKLIGNHDVRLRDFVLDSVPELHGLKRAEIGTQEASIFSPEFLLRLDELGIELIGDGASYEHGQFNASKYLAARHGWIATKGSGSSALKTLDHLGYSVIVGHTHRLSLVHQTKHDINGTTKNVYAAAESGCMCSVDIQGLGYNPAPDWQQGFATATIWPDGFFKIDLATYIDGSLLWRGERYC